MPCALTGSQQLDCKDSIGGIKEIKIKAHPGLSEIETNFTVSSGSITAIASGSRSSWYTWNLEKENAAATFPPVTNEQNGTTFWAHEFKMMPNKSSARLSYEIQQIARNRTIIAIRDMNDRYYILGMRYGMHLSAAVAGSGQARGDRNGYELTLSGKEDLPEQDITAAIWATLVT